ncbi:AMP-binding protein, partial [Agrobacterium rhizogenes]|nr:AMP-binding protein [Rhizobium rhizogenes]
LGAYAHQDLPFEKLVEELQPARDLSRQPIFQVFVNGFFPDAAEIELPGVDLHPLDVGQTGSKFDITLYIRARDSGLASLRFNYNADLFDAPTIERMAGHLQILLDGALADPAARISRLPLLSETERQLREVSGTQEALGSKSLVAGFERNVELQPDALAVEDEHSQWSYHQLQQESDRISSVLGRGDMVAPSKVGLLLAPNNTMVAAMLGTLKANSWYVPIDPSLPVSRIQYIVDDAQLNSLVYSMPDEQIVKQLNNDHLQLISAESKPAYTSGHRDTNDGAYILYTSGTTGEPKGVFQTELNASAHIENYIKLLRPTDRLVQFASYGFDASVMDTYGALLSGASVHFYDIQRQGIDALEEWLLTRKITVWHSTPTVLRIAQSYISRRSTSSIRIVVLGGEEALPSDLEIVASVFKADCQLINGYGPTECTLALQYHGVAQKAEGRVPIGKPVSGTTVLLLDQEGNQADLVGEIALSSPHIAIGYLGRPGLTAERFVPSPFGRGERLYRTGDLGRW